MDKVLLVQTWLAWQQVQLELKTLITQRLTETLGIPHIHYKRVQAMYRASFYLIQKDYVL